MTPSAAPFSQSVAIWGDDNFRTRD